MIPAANVHLGTKNVKPLARKYRNMLIFAYMINIYSITTPVFIKMLGGLKTVLTKAEAHIKEKGVSEDAFLNDALAPDMFPFKRQIQIASDNAKGAVSRLTGKENPKMEDTETTFTQLHERIDKTIAFVQSATEADFEGAGDRKISLSYYPNKYMTGTEYATGYAIPNFLFHVTIAYAIARKNGVPLGKADYINGLPLKDL